MFYAKPWQQLWRQLPRCSNQRKKAAFSRWARIVSREHEQMICAKRTSLCICQPTATSGKARLPCGMRPSEEECRHEYREKNGNQRITASCQDSLVVQCDHEKGHAGHEEARKTHVLNGPNLVWEDHDPVQPILRVDPLVEEIYCFQAMEIHEAQEARHIVWSEAVLYVVPPHPFNPMLVKVNGARQEYNSSGVDAMCEILRGGCCEQVR